MIQAIESIKGIGRFEDFSWQTGVPTFSKVNLVLGYNGSGKSTLSNVFRLFSSREADGGAALVASLNTGGCDPVVTVKIDSRQVSFKPTCTKTPIYVFNSDFTSDHVYSGNQFTFQAFDSTVVTREQLSNPAIAALEAQIRATEAGLSAKRNQAAAIESMFQNHKTAMSKEFNSRIKGQRMPSFSVVQTAPEDSFSTIRQKLDQAYASYDLSTKQQQLRDDIGLIEGLSILQLKTVISDAEEFLAKSTTQLSKNVIEDRLAELKNFHPKHSTLAEWFQDAYGLLQFQQAREASLCAVCGSDIRTQIPSLLDTYAAYFSKKYEEIIASLDAVNAVLGADAAQLEINRNASGTLHQVAQKYGINSTEIAIPDIEQLPMRECLDSAISVLQLKKGAIDRLDLRLDDGTASNVADYNSQVKLLVEAKRNLVSKLRTQIIDTVQAAQQVKALIPLCCNAATDESADGGQLAVLSALNQDIADLVADLSLKQQRRTKELAALRKESKYVNIYLQKMGITHFQISFGPGDSSDIVMVVYTSGQSRSELRHSLSEGEKTALAFSYFMSKLQYEVLDNPKACLADVTIVIDDPVSSLDEDRLHSTACLIAARFSECSQLFVLSHNIAFMRFFSGVVGDPQEGPPNHQESVRRDYYLCNYAGCLQELPRQLKNYSTTYFQKLDDIMSFAKGEIGYEVAKNFIPSYVRTVLESFFSFKLSIVSQGSSSHKYQTGGLDKIIKRIEGAIGVFKSFKAVRGVDATSLVEILSNIKRITDPQVHGTPNDVTDVRFVSEAELRQIADQTIAVIEFVDAIHIQEVGKDF